MKYFYKRLLTLIVGALLCFLAYVALTNVVVEINSAEQKMLPAFLSGKRDTFETLPYEESISLIEDVMIWIGNQAKKPEGVPHGVKRGIESIVKSESGVCYDRSYAIEQVLHYLGAEVRHVYIYYPKSGNLLGKYIESHAMTEVKTSKGWLLIDSLSSDVYLDGARNPVGVADHRSGKQVKNLKNPDARLISRQYEFLYGLYSRNGGFFPVYFLPLDANYETFIIANVGRLFNK